MHRSIPSIPRDLPAAHIETGTRADTLVVTISGEFDIANHEELRAALTAVEMNGARTVRVRLSRPIFLDVGAFRDLHRFAENIQQHGRDAIVEGATPTLRKMSKAFDAQYELIE